MERMCWNLVLEIIADLDQSKSDSNPSPENILCKARYSVCTVQPGSIPGTPYWRQVPHFSPERFRIGAEARRSCCTLPGGGGEKVYSSQGNYILAGSDYLGLSASVRQFPPTHLH